MKAPADIVLATTSSYRIREFRRIGVPFRSVSPGCDEEALKSSAADLGPEALALYLARAKAESVERSEPSALVIGGDQLAAIDDTVLGKPLTREGAEAQLGMLAGRTHRLITAVAVIAGGVTITHVDVTKLTMRELSAEQIARYVAADSPLDCAGSYKIEERGVTLFERIESADHSAITGFPLIALTTILLHLGVEVGTFGAVY